MGFWVFVFWFRRVWGFGVVGGGGCFFLGEIRLGSLGFWRRKEGGKGRIDG